MMDLLKKVLHQCHLRVSGGGYAAEARGLLAMLTLIVLACVVVRVF